MKKKRERLPGEHGRIYHSHGKKKNGMYFADFVPQNAPTIFAKIKVNTRHFLKEYAFACKVTVVLLVITFMAVIIRYSQKSSLASLLATVTTVSQDYNSLVSAASAAKAQSSDGGNETITEDETTAPSGTPESTVFSFSQNEDVPAQNQSPGNNQPPSNGGNDPGGDPDPPPPPPPFVSSIAGFQLNNPSGNLECQGVITITRLNCQKSYNFSARVSTKNGPGTVEYGWLTNVSGGNSNDSYEATAGEQTQNLGKSVTISCRNPGNYAMRFIISAPNSVQSTPIEINHNCND